jgi:hypothetical protein
MNRIIYFVVLILFLIMIKQIVFMDEGFHTLTQVEIAAAAAEQAREDADIATAVSVAVAKAESQFASAEEAAEAAKTEFNVVLAEANIAASNLAAAAAAAAAANGTDVSELQGAKVDAEKVRVRLITALATRNTALAAINQFSDVVLPILHLSSEEEHTPITTFEVIDKQCCGVDIHDIELKNIGKCVSQHIKPDMSDPANPTFSEWIDTASDSDCKNPHRILSRTSNCNAIVTKFEPSWQTLLTRIRRTGCEQCDYLRYLQEESQIVNGDISRNEKLWIFKNKVACELRNKSDLGDGTYTIRDEEFQIMTCSDNVQDTNPGACGSI